MFLEQTREADALTSEQLRSEHRVENTLRFETAEVVQQPQIEIAAVHHEMLVREHAPERLELHSGREDIDEKNFAVDEELQQADPRFVVIHVVRLGIEEHLVHPLERGQQRSQ